MNKKLVVTLLAFFITLFFNVSEVLAQVSTISATTATSSGSTDSASYISTDSATTSSQPTTLPTTGAHDVLILTFAGIIFLFAGVTVLSGTKRVFNDLE